MIESIINRRRIVCLVLVIVICSILFYYQMHPVLIHQHAINPFSVEKNYQILNISNITVANMSLAKMQEGKMQWVEHAGVNYGDGTCNTTLNTTRYIELLKKWKEIAKVHNIPYFIMGGSLLGSARNGKLIPYEVDADVMMDGGYNEVIATIAVDREDVINDEKFRIVIQKDYKYNVHNRANRRRFNCKGEVVNGQTDQCAFQEPVARLMKGLTTDVWYNYIDIYDFHIENQTLYDPSEYGRYYDLEVVFPMKKCWLLQIEMRCPNQPVPFLKLRYGQDVMMPDTICKEKVWVKA